jgi:hypothetical protein
MIDIYLKVGISSSQRRGVVEARKMDGPKSKRRVSGGAPDVCAQLRAAIRASGKTHYRIGKDAGVKPEIVARFVRAERDVRAETFAKIAAALGLELRTKGE